MAKNKLAKQILQHIEFSCIYMEKLVINVKIVHILARLAVERQRTVVKDPFPCGLGMKVLRSNPKMGWMALEKNKPCPRPLAH